MGRVYKTKEEKDKMWEQIRSGIQDREVAALKYLIEQSLNGEQSWRKPWSMRGFEQRNTVDHVYQNTNQLRMFVAAMLNEFQEPRWGTESQIAALGGKMPKMHNVPDADKEILIYPLLKDVDKVDPKTGKTIINPETGKPEKETIFVAWRFTKVVNLAQPFVTGIEPYKPKDYTPEEITAADNLAFAKAEFLIQDFARKNNLRIVNLPQNRASFRHNIMNNDESVKSGRILLPMKEQFNSSAEYYATALHELAHSTMLLGKRTQDEFSPIGQKLTFGSKGYAREELVAELTSLLVCKQLGIDVTNNELSRQSFNYIAGWYKEGKLTDADLRVALTDAQEANKAIVSSSAMVQYGFTMDDLLKLEQARVKKFGNVEISNEPIQLDFTAQKEAIFDAVMESDPSWVRNAEINQNGEVEEFIFKPVNEQDIVSLQVDNVDNKIVTTISLNDSTIDEITTLNTDDLDAISIATEVKNIVARTNTSSNDVENTVTSDLLENNNNNPENSQARLALAQAQANNPNLTAEQVNFDVIKMDIADIGNLTNSEQKPVLGLNAFNNRQDWVSPPVVFSDNSALAVDKETGLLHVYAPSDNVANYNNEVEALKSDRENVAKVEVSNNELLEANALVEQVLDDIRKTKASGEMSKKASEEAALLLATDDETFHNVRKLLVGAHKAGNEIASAHSEELNEPKPSKLEQALEQFRVLATKAELPNLNAINQDIDDRLIAARAEMQQARELVMNYRQNLAAQYQASINGELTATQNTANEHKALLEATSFKDIEEKDTNEIVEQHFNQFKEYALANLGDVSVEIAEKELRRLEKQVFAETHTARSELYFNENYQNYQGLVNDKFMESLINPDNGFVENDAINVEAVAKWNGEKLEGDELNINDIYNHIEQDLHNTIVLDATGDELNYLNVSKNNMVQFDYTNNKDEQAVRRVAVLRADFNEENPEKSLLRGFDLDKWEPRTFTIEKIQALKDAFTQEPLKLDDVLAKADLNVKSFAIPQMAMKHLVSDAIHGVRHLEQTKAIENVQKQAQEEVLNVKEEVARKQEKESHTVLNPAHAIVVTATNEVLALGKDREHLIDIYRQRQGFDTKEDALQDLKAKGASDSTLHYAQITRVLNQDDFLVKMSSDAMKAVVDANHKIAHNSQQVKNGLSIAEMFAQATQDGTYNPVLRKAEIYTPKGDEFNQVVKNYAVQNGLPVPRPSDVDWTFNDVNKLADGSLLTLDGDQIIADANIAYRLSRISEYFNENVLNTLRQDYSNVMKIEPTPKPKAEQSVENNVENDVNFDNKPTSLEVENLTPSEQNLTEKPVEPTLDSTTTDLEAKNVEVSNEKPSVQSETVTPTPSDMVQPSELGNEQPEIAKSESVKLESAEVEITTPEIDVTSPAIETNVAESSPEQADEKEVENTIDSSADDTIEPFSLDEINEVENEIEQTPPVAYILKLNKVEDGEIYDYDYLAMATNNEDLAAMVAARQYFEDDAEYAAFVNENQANFETIEIRHLDLANMMTNLTSAFNIVKDKRTIDNLIKQEQDLATRINHIQNDPSFAERVIDAVKSLATRQEVTPKEVYQLMKEAGINDNKPMYAENNGKEVKGLIQMPDNSQIDVRGTDEPISLSKKEDRIANNIAKASKRISEEIRETLREMRQDFYYRKMTPEKLEETKQEITHNQTLKAPAPRP